MNSQRLKMADVIRQWIAAVWDSGEGFPADDDEFYEAFIYWGIYNQSSPLMKRAEYKADRYTVAWRGVQDG